MAFRVGRVLLRAGTMATRSKSFYFSKPIAVLNNPQRFRMVSTSFYLSEEMSERKYAWSKNLFLEDSEPREVTAEDVEQKERQDLLEKLRELYFANPPKEPQADFYLEAFELLMKYDDTQGVEAVIAMMQESKVKISEEYLDKVEEYLVKARERSWFN